MMLKLLKNKKGIGFIGSLINVVSDTIGHIRELLKMMFSKAPKILYPILFLFFILIIGGLMNFFLQMTGFHCDMEKNTVKMSTFDVGDNWDIWQFEINDDIVNSTIIGIEETGWGVSKCSKTVADGSYKYENGTIINFTDEISFYDGKFCDVCIDLVKVSGNDAETVFGVSSRKLCLGNVERNNNVTGRHLLFWTKKERCESGKECMPPVGYHFNAVNNFYESDLSYNGSKTLGETYNNLLFTQYKAVPFSFNNETKPVDISCTNDYDVNLTFFTIDIFSYVLWIFLFILGSMVYVYINFIK